MKKDTIIILIFSSIIALLIFFRKPIKKIMTRGYRNNNPGNIRLTTKKWIGEIDGTDKDFKTFKSMPYGYRAIFALLREYISKGYDTIEKIINRYAPPSENITSAYVKTVEKRTGIDKNRLISFNEIDIIFKLVNSISYVENGIEPNQNDINEGYKLLS
jgi:hypothetical protein